LTCATLYTFELPTTQQVFAHASSDGIYALHAHGQYLYWAEGPRIVRANLDGGDRTVLYEGSQPINDLSVDDTDVYFATDIALYRTPG
jgi:hypothetical protein